MDITQRLTQFLSPKICGASFCFARWRSAGSRGWYRGADRFEIVFDTLTSSRKAPNLRANPRDRVRDRGHSGRRRAHGAVRGIADEPSGGELDRLLAVYYADFPTDPSGAHGLD